MPIAEKKNMNYFWSYRRKLLDKDLEEAKEYMKGMVLDIGGGQKRGTFEKPNNARWIVLDVTEEYKPDVLTDAHKLPIKTGVIDGIKCTEVLQYLENPDEVLKEMNRVLKPGGFIILSVPFNLGGMLDFPELQRFTDYKLKKMLKGFDINALKKQGLFFTVLCYMIKQAILNMKSRIRWLFYWSLPVLDALVKLDNFDFVKSSRFLSSFTTGYFVVAVKKYKNIEDK